MAVGSVLPCNRDTKLCKATKAISTVDHHRCPFTPALSSGFSSRESPLLLYNITPDWILIMLVNLNSPFFSSALFHLWAAPLVILSAAALHPVFTRKLFSTSNFYPTCVLSLSWLSFLPSSPPTLSAVVMSRRLMCWSSVRDHLHLAITPTDHDFYRVRRCSRAARIPILRASHR
jgi:hypothetical protein